LVMVMMALMLTIEMIVMMLGMQSMTHLIGNLFKMIDQNNFNNHLKHCHWSQSFFCTHA
jgi:hypothetical protein